MLEPRARNKFDVFENCSRNGHPNFLDPCQLMAATRLSWSALAEHIAAGRLVPKSPPGHAIQELFHVEDVAALVGK